MKIAAYNVENMIVRATIFNQDDNYISSKIQKGDAAKNSLLEFDHSNKDDYVTYYLSSQSKNRAFIYFECAHS